LATDKNTKFMTFDNPRYFAASKSRCIVTIRFEHMQGSTKGIVSGFDLLQWDNWVHNIKLNQVVVYAWEKTLFYWKTIWMTIVCCVWLYQV